jgi:ABC-type bacteriocin/lantibiotic exporter with double-glycine peptidase domain
VSLLLAALLGAQPLAVPFVAQQEDSCGAAALAMVMRFWQRPLAHDEIVAALLQPELRGIRGSRLEAFAREHGMTAIAYQGDIAQLREYVAKGRPLIVAWRLARDRYHDVVVVGFDAGRVIVNDPAEGAGRAVDARSFEKRWRGAGHWTLLVLPAAEPLPAP